MSSFSDYKNTVIKTIPYKVVYMQNTPFPVIPLPFAPPPYENLGWISLLFQFIQLHISICVCIHIQGGSWWIFTYHYTTDLHAWQSVISQTSLQVNRYRYTLFSDAFMQIHADFCNKPKKDPIISGGSYFCITIFFCPTPKSCNHITCANKTAVSSLPFSCNCLQIYTQTSFLSVSLIKIASCEIYFFTFIFLLNNTSYKHF